MPRAGKGTPVAVAAPVAADTVSLAVIDAREHVLDRNGDARADAIEVELEVRSAIARPVRVQGWIEAPGSPVPREFVESTERLAAGTATTRLVFDASRLHRSRVDGPYTIHLTVEAGDGPRLERALHTRAYRAREFEAPDLSLRPGMLRSHVVVALGPYGNRRYRVDLPVQVRQPGLFACRAVLRGDSLAAGGYAEMMLESGAQLVSLDFGSDARLADAPNARWTISDCECLNGAGLPQWEPVALVVGDSLAPSDFRDPRGEAVRSDGPPILRALDDDQDGVFEALEYRAPVVSRTAGEVRVFASLARDTSVIADRQELAQVPAGRCTLVVRYPGEQVYAAAGSGLLRVHGAFAFAVSRVGWPDAGLALGDAIGEPTGRPLHARGRHRGPRARGRATGRAQRRDARAIGDGWSAHGSGRCVPAPCAAGGRPAARALCGSIRAMARARAGVCSSTGGRRAAGGKAEMVLEAGRELSVSFEHD